MLMTLVDFRTKAGLGGNVSEGAKIRTVQLRLTDCHADNLTNEQQTAAKEALEDAIGAWRKSHTPTTSWTKKGRNKGKRRAMDELQWQVEATLINADLDIIMDRAHFRQLAGLGARTVEGKGIKTVQHRLNDYHGAGDGEKPAALTALAEACEAWRAAHVKPVNLSDRSLGKKQAMDQLEWQLTMSLSAALPGPQDLGDMSDLAQALFDGCANVHVANGGTVTKLTQLMGRLRTMYNDVSRRGDDPSENKAVRVATVDLNSMELLQLVHERFPQDDDGPGDSALHPPTMAFDANTQRMLAAYLKSLLTNDLPEITAAVRAAGALGGKHRAMISVDYYWGRSTDQLALHKDTTGTTVFVALHYANRSEMTGPEYIHDRWPIPGQEEYTKTDMTVLGSAEAWNQGSTTRPKRKRAPWSRNVEYVPNMGRYVVADGAEAARVTGGYATHYWPAQLIDSLEEARARLPVHGEMEYTTLGPYGLISFVDELIYHTTPLKSERGTRSAFTFVRFGGGTYNFGPENRALALTRRMSTAIRDTDFEPKTGFADKRTFLRLWISIAPTEWYEPFAKWSGK